jgi:hypothetical protein
MALSMLMQINSWFLISEMPLLKRQKAAIWQIWEYKYKAWI